MTVPIASTRVVLLTPPGRGAVATLLVTGADAISSVERSFAPARSGPLNQLPLGKICFGRWGGSQGEEVVVCRHREKQVRVHCHGGHAAAERIQSDLAGAGCVSVSWQSWLSTADSDPIRVAAHLALSQAPTLRTASILLDQSSGALRSALERAIEQIETGQFASAADSLQSLLMTAPIGQHLIEPWKVVLAGPPNAGKSSLINQLMGYQRAIVYDQPGTTRDVVTARTAIGGWPVELADTAGLRASAQPAEAMGIELAEQSLASADVKLLVFDLVEPFGRESQALADRFPGALIVHNKSDLASQPITDRPPGIEVSALTAAGTARLIEKIAGQLVPQPPESGAAVLFCTAQVGAIQQSHKLLVASQPEAAMALLERI